MTLKAGKTIPTLGRIGQGLYQATLGRIWSGFAPTVKIIAGAGPASIIDAAGTPTVRSMAKAPTIRDIAGTPTIRRLS